MPTIRLRAQAGVTLIEMTTVLAIAATLVGVGIPSFKNTTTRQALVSQSGELGIDLRYLRSEAVSRSRTLRVGFGSDAAGTCYVIHSGSSGACTCSSGGLAQCNDGAEALKTVGLPAARGVRLQSNVASMLFDAQRGTVTPAGTLKLIDRDGRTVHHVVNILGRARTCSPGGAVAGYKAC